jgi:AcrR family transcriptional regulator
MKTIDGLTVPEAILRMAIPTFVERGYEKASMDEVAARASTTKRTVYAHYRSKDGLFRAALAKAVEMFLSELPRLDATADPTSELERFAVRFTEMCTWRGAVSLQRVVIAEAGRFPDLGAMLHRDVIQRTERLVADYLSHFRMEAVPRPTACDRRVLDMASLFLNMTSGPLRFATLLQAQVPAQDHPDVKPSAAVDRDYIRRAVQVFVTGSGLSRA